MESLPCLEFQTLALCRVTDPVVTGVNANDLVTLNTGDRSAMVNGDHLSPGECYPQLGPLQGLICQDLNLISE